MIGNGEGASPLWRRCELPTWALTVAIYGGWLALTWWASELPWWIVGALGGWLVAWHGSLQHEVIHGHPTRYERLNLALGWLPLGLWLPLGIYRDEHLAHHDAAPLTDPLEDPESNYVTAERWARAGALGRAYLWVRATLLGRAILGPPEAALYLYRGELRRVWGGDRRRVRHWLAHGAGVAVVLAWVVGVCGVSPWVYALLFAYPGSALTLVRSYAEHRPAPSQPERTAVVERAPLLGPLFLFNNLHIVHHAHPGLAWYEIPARYRAFREHYLRKNGGYCFRSYAAIALRYALRPLDHPVHPAHRSGAGVGDRASRGDVRASPARATPAAATAGDGSSSAAPAGAAPGGSSG